MKRSIYILVGFCLFLNSFAVHAQTQNSEYDLNAVRKAIGERGAKWTAEENWVTRLSPDERRRLLGALDEKPDLSKARLLNLSKAAQLPSALDWRNNNGNWVTPPKNQGACGSCWDFSAVGQVESWWKIFHNDPDSVIDLSEQFVLSCSDAGDCDGGYTTEALSFIQSVGVPSETCFPYEADDRVPCSDACGWWASEAVIIPGWGYITLDEPIVDNIKYALYRHPVSASFDVYSDFSYYSSGIYEHVWGGYEGGHAILIIGWNDADSCWICKNSWGENWGEGIGSKRGYFRIKWSEVEIGRNMPFVWDGMVSSALGVNPSEINLTLTQGDSSEQTITLTNSGPGAVQFSSVDYQLDKDIPEYFHINNFNAYDGNSWWCGDPNIGGYNDHWLQYLDTPVLNLSQSSNPQLTWRGYWAVEDPAGTDPPWDGWDGCNVWVSTDSGKTFEVAVPTSPAYNCQNLWSFGHEIQGWDLGTGIAGWGGKSGGWKLVTFDLSSFKSENVIIRWALASDLAWCGINDPTLFGLFADDILVTDNGSTVFEDHGNAGSQMQPLGYGLSAADWLQIEEPVSEVAPYGTLDLQMMIHTQTLMTGSYTGFIQINSNDTMINRVKIPVYLTVDPSSGVFAPQTGTAPKDWTLYPNYPNPFNNTTVIPFGLPKGAEISISVYNPLGQEIRTLFDGFKDAGHHQVSWDGLDRYGCSTGSGMYIIRMKGIDFIRTQKMIMVK